MVELIITEKPSSAKKIAEALADGKPILKKSKQSQYYEITHGKHDIIVTSAVGHLYGLMEEKIKEANSILEKSGWKFNEKEKIFEKKSKSIAEEVVRKLS